MKKEEFQVSSGYSHFCSDCYEEASEFARKKNVPLLRYERPEIVEGVERPAPDAMCRCGECGVWKEATTSTLQEDRWLCKDCRDVEERDG